MRLGYFPSGIQKDAVEDKEYFFLLDNFKNHIRSYKCIDHKTQFKKYKTKTFEFYFCNATFLKHFFVATKF